MRNNQTLRELFYPLGVRLGYFEYEKYLTGNLNIDEGGPDFPGFEYKDLMGYISETINYYDPKDSYLLVQQYITRVEPLFKKMEEKQLDSTFLKNGVVTKIKASRRKLLLQFWVAELGHYLLHLYMIREVTEKFVTKTDTPTNALKRNKIKWLGQKNQLATLIFDLWQGQETMNGGPSQKSKLESLMDAKIEDFIALITDNFVDSDGKDFTRSNLPDILSKSRSNIKDKAQGDKRIKLYYK